jgi:ribonuclease VapC
VIVVDASAIVAILLREPEADDFVDVLEAQAPAFASPTSIFESVAALVRTQGCSVSDARVILDDLMKVSGIAVESITVEMCEAAVTAFDRFGKGRHPAGLNMGDCYSYALAKTLRLPLLFKGDDFSRTDLERAV